MYVYPENNTKKGFCFIMKRKLLSLLMAVTMVAAFTGCGDSKKPAASDTEDTSNKEIEAADYYASVQKNAEIYKKYVTHGEYKRKEEK